MRRLIDVFKAFFGNEHPRRKLQRSTRQPRKVGIYWSTLSRSNNRLWHAKRRLYVYLHPETNKILYIGQANRMSVRGRHGGNHKDKIFKQIETRFGLTKARLLVIHGKIVLEKGRIFSPELLKDIESLLIYRLKPSCNDKSKQTRTYRLGLQVKCEGDWPLPRNSFRDRKR